MHGMTFLAIILSAAAITIAHATGWATLGVIAGFWLLAYLPGRLVLGLILDSRWDFAGRTILSIALSLSIAPFFLNLAWHITNEYPPLLGATCAVLLALTAIPTVRRTLDQPPNRLFEHRRTRILAAVTALLVLPPLILTYWPTEMLGFPLASTIHDFVKHQAVLDSLARRPLPLGNVFFADGASMPVHYYHWFYLIPATVRVWTNQALSNELAFGLSSALTAIGLVGVCYMLTKRLAGEMPATLTLVLVTIVGALDVFPLIPFVIDLGRPVVTLDAWAEHPFRIHNFLNQMIWSPQNVAGLLIVLVTAYLLSEKGPSRCWLWLGPILGASLLGTSVWVAMGAVPALVLWTLTKPRLIPRAAVVGAIMTLFCWPTIQGYLEGASHHGRGLSLDWPVNPHGVVGWLTGPGIAANFLDLPLTMTLELGAKFLFLVLVPSLIWRRIWRDDGLRFLLLCAVVSVLAFCTVRSELRHNDFGQKTILLAMAFGAVAAGAILTDQPVATCWWNPLGWRIAMRRGATVKAVLVGAVLILGLPVALYEAPLTAARRYADFYRESARMSADERSAVRDEGLVLRYMRHSLPADAVVQGEGTVDRARLAQLVRRQIGVMDQQDDILVFDPPDLSPLRLAIKEVLGVLRRPASPEETYRLLRRHGITHVFVGIVERRMWKNLDRFSDTRFFKIAFRSGESLAVELVRR